MENEQGKLAGIISWLEIVRHYGQGNARRAAAPIAVAAVMQSTPVTVPPETSLLAIALMRKERLDYLLVVKDDHSVGIVTSTMFAANHRSSPGTATSRFSYGV